ncbi:MAG: phenylphosphate synthase subunit beta [Chloroflexi bacterium]|nr:phenylphosphate synthase subunit beta [Chloroflexota bacterium]
MTAEPYILWFQDCDKTFLPRVGGKNASLGEMTRAGIRVPPGFAVTTAAYRNFLKLSGLEVEIGQILDDLHGKEPQAAEEASHAIRQMLGSSPVPAAIEDAICGAYEKLCAECGVPDLPVAVRSSATAEDLPGASFAGQQDTALWVCSASHVLIRTAICWSSLFTARAISYRNDMGFPHDKVLISVGVQKMANSHVSGVMFTINPLNGDRSKIVLDASWGLGESVVSGVVTPDNYMVDKVTLTVIRRTASPKMIEYLPDVEAGRVQIQEVPPERQTELCLSDEALVELARLGKQIERHYGAPQDIEWAIDRDLPPDENIVILQSRPETVWSQKQRTIAGNHATGVEGVLATLLTPVRVKVARKD